MTKRMEIKKLSPDKIEYVYYPPTEAETRATNWPCEMCENNIRCYPSTCSSEQCQSEKQRAKKCKPLNFVVQTSYLLHSCRWGTRDTNRTATKWEQKERVEREADRKAKKYKVCLVIGVCLFIAGVIISAVSPHASALFIFTGPLLCYYGRRGAWWHKG